MDIPFPQVLPSGLPPSYQVADEVKDLNQGCIFRYLWKEDERIHWTCSFSV